jgi:hypothetical protein
LAFEKFFAPKIAFAFVLGVWLVVPVDPDVVDTLIKSEGGARYEERLDLPNLAIWLLDFTVRDQ